MADEMKLTGSDVTWENIDGLLAENAINNKPEGESLRTAKRELDSFYLIPQNMDENIRWERLLIFKNDSTEERNLRKEYAKKAFKFSYYWAGFIALIILLKGFGKHIGFYLSQVEFLSLIGALSATIFGYYTFVMKYLFTRNNTLESKKK